MERDIAHNLISYDNDYFLLQIADRTSSEEYIREVQADILWQKRLDLIPASLDWLRFKSPEEYTLIYEYYFLLSEDRAKLHILSQKYGVSMMAISRRLAKTRSKLKDFILSHENDW
jgi:transcriptional antiterminator